MTISRHALTPTAAAEAYLAAYNDHDDERLLALCHNDVVVIHHNRAIDWRGKAQFREMLARFRGAMPDKRFAERRALHVAGESVIVEHTWRGTAIVDTPGFAAKDEVVTVELATRFTVREGLIVEYHDYG